MLDTDEVVQYYLNTSTRELMRGMASGAMSTATPAVVMDGVDTFSFEFRDAFGTPVTSSTGNNAIRQVRLRLKVGTSTTTGAVKSQGGRQYNDVDVVVKPRNLGLPKIPTYIP